MRGAGCTAGTAAACASGGWAVAGALPSAGAGRGSVTGLSSNPAPLLVLGLELSESELLLLLLLLLLVLLSDSLVLDSELDSKLELGLDVPLRPSAAGTAGCESMGGCCCSAALSMTPVSVDVVAIAPPRTSARLCMAGKRAIPAAAVPSTSPGPACSPGSGSASQPGVAALKPGACAGASASWARSVKPMAAAAECAASSLPASDAAPCAGPLTRPLSVSAAAWMPSSKGINSAGWVPFVMTAAVAGSRERALGGIAVAGGGCAVGTSLSLSLPYPAAIPTSIQCAAEGPTPRPDGAWFYLAMAHLRKVTVALLAAVMSTQGMLTCHQCAGGNDVYGWANRASCHCRRAHWLATAAGGFTTASPVIERTSLTAAARQRGTRPVRFRITRLRQDKRRSGKTGEGHRERGTATVVCCRHAMRELPFDR